MKLGILFVCMVVKVTAASKRSMPIKTPKIELNLPTTHIMRIIDELPDGRMSWDEFDEAHERLFNLLCNADHKPTEGEQAVIDMVRGEAVQMFIKVCPAAEYLLDPSCEQGFSRGLQVLDGFEKHLIENKMARETGLSIAYVKGCLEDESCLARMMLLCQVGHSGQ